MKCRERVMKALNFESVDRLPRDLGGMRSTCISAFAYPKLVEALGLPPRRPRVYDVMQMLALPDQDVLDALGCDVVMAEWDVTNAFDQSDKWEPYDFGGRLEALVRHPDYFEVQDDGTVVMGGLTMLPGSTVFDSEHGGQPLILEGDLPKPDLGELRERLEQKAMSDADAEGLAAFYRQVRESTDRAVMMDTVRPGLGIAGYGGIAVFPMLCVMEPDFVRDLHELQLEFALPKIRKIMGAVGEYVDVVMVSADDWGTQEQTVASPDVYRDLFKPYYKMFNDVIHETAPGVKTFIHTCGAVYNLIDDFAESGFDVMNPVQWTAGGRSYKEWKDKARGKIALWGGGVDSQGTLPLGSVEDVEKQVAEVASYLAGGSGYVFNGIHNILAEIEPEKIIAMYRVAGEIETE